MPPGATGSRQVGSDVAASLGSPTSRLIGSDRGQNAFGDPPGPFANSVSLRDPAKRIDFDHLRPNRDRNIVVGQPSQNAVQGRSEDCPLDLRDVLPLADATSYPRISTKRPLNWCVDIAVAGVASNGSRLAGQRPRGPVGNHGAEPIPTRLDQHVSVPTRNKSRPQADSQVSASNQYLGRRVLAHTRIHDRTTPKRGEQRFPLSDVYGNRRAFLECPPHVSKVVGATGAHPVEASFPIEDRVRECHAPACGRRFGLIVDYDTEAGLKQPVGDSRANVSHPAHDYDHVGSL